MVSNPKLHPQTRRNLVTYGILMLITIIGIVYGNFIRDDHNFLRVWEYQNTLVLLAGVPFLFLQRTAGIPDLWETNIPNKNRLLYPALIGMVFGILDVLIIKVIMHPEPYQELPPFLQPFPYSLFLFLSGAFEIEVFYRLIPLTIILLAGKWLASGKYFNAFFWTGAIITSIREPLEQMPDGGAYFIAYALISGFAMNLLQAIHFKKSGFLASLSLRLGHYLFWHILLGVYVQYAEL